MSFRFKKIIFIFLLAFTSQLYGYQYQDNSTIFFADLLTWQVREGSAPVYYGDLLTVRLI